MNKPPHLRGPAVPFALRWVLGAALGAVVGAGAMLVAYPFVFPPAAAHDAPPVALSAAPGGVAPSRVFRLDENAPGRDRIHWANGTGIFVHTAQGWVLRLQGDFRAGPGPNFWLYLNTREVGQASDFRADTGRIKLAALRSFEGAQNYLLPAGVDPSRFHTLTIWCETFGVYIASGALAEAPVAPAAEAPRQKAAGVPA